MFLPSVWEQLPSPETFLTHLFHKAGLDLASCADDLRAFGFTAEKLADAPAPSADHCPDGTIGPNGFVEPAVR